MGSPLSVISCVAAFQNPLRPRRSGEAYGTGSISSWMEITADDRDSKSIPSPERKDELVSHQYLHLQTLAIGTRSSSDMFVVRGWM